jgi:hypothetical protein
MCLELRESNLYDTDILIEKLNKIKGLFKNSQSRYFISNPNNISTESVLDNMLLLDMVGITEQYQSSLEKFINDEWVGTATCQISQVNLEKKSLVKPVLLNLFYLLKKH